MDRWIGYDPYIYVHVSFTTTTDFLHCDTNNIGFQKDCDEDF